MAWLTALGRRGGEIILVWHYLTFDLLFPALLSVTMVSLILATGRRLKTFRALPAQLQSMFALVAGAALHACRLCPEHRGGAAFVRFPVGQSGFAVSRLSADRHQIRAFRHPGDRHRRFLAGGPETPGLTQNGGAIHEPDRDLLAVAGAGAAGLHRLYRDGPPQIRRGQVRRGQGRPVQDALDRAGLQRHRCQQSHQPVRIAGALLRAVPGAARDQRRQLPDAGA